MKEGKWIGGEGWKETEMLKGFEAKQKADRKAERETAEREEVNSVGYLFLQRAMLACRGLPTDMSGIYDN